MIRVLRYVGPHHADSMEDAEAFSDPDAPLVITRCLPDVQDTNSVPEAVAIAITHKTSGKKVYLPSSLAAARLALPELLKLTDWSVPAADLEKRVGLKARVEAVQDAADKKLEETR